jgi:acyl carrier protein
VIDKNELKLAVIQIIASVTNISTEKISLIKRELDGIWDSLNHIEIILQTESHFNIEFNEEEIESIVDLDSLLEVILNKLKR